VGLVPVPLLPMKALLAYCVIIGAAAGAILGVVLDSLLVWMTLGALLGVLAWLATRRSRGES
jgi:hypothetical protein